MAGKLRSSGVFSSFDNLRGGAQKNLNSVRTACATPLCLPRSGCPARRWRLLSLVLFVGAMRLVGAEPIKFYSTLTLKDGRQFLSVEIVNYTSGGILVRHAKGATIGKIEPHRVLVKVDGRRRSAHAMLARSDRVSMA